MAGAVDSPAGWLAVAVAVTVAVALGEGGLGEGRLGEGGLEPAGAASGADGPLVQPASAARSAVVATAPRACMLRR